MTYLFEVETWYVNWIRDMIGNLYDDVLRHSLCQNAYGLQPSEALSYTIHRVAADGTDDHVSPKRSTAMPIEWRIPINKGWSCCPSTILRLKWGTRVSTQEVAGQSYGTRSEHCKLAHWSAKTTKALLFGPLKLCCLFALLLFCARCFCCCLFLFFVVLLYDHDGSYPR